MFVARDLIQGPQQLATIRPQDAVSDALRLMFDRDFSQLPVLDEDGRPLGLLTFKSILRALTLRGGSMEELRVRYAYERRCPKFTWEDDLFDVLDELQQDFVVVLVDGAGRLTHVLTAFDAAEFFRQRAQDFMCVEDIETTLKDSIQADFLDEDGELDTDELDRAAAGVASQRVRELQGALHHCLQKAGLSQRVDPAIVQDVAEQIGAASTSFDELPMGAYIELFLRSKRVTGETTLDRNLLRKLLEEVRETRNSIAHFRSRATPWQRDQLKYCMEWLGRLQPAQTPQKPPAAPVAVQPPVHEPAEAAAPDRYAPLLEHLARVPAHAPAVRLSYRQLEGLVGPLPRAAREHRSWWDHDVDGQVHVHPWVLAGWHVTAVESEAEFVTFSRLTRNYLGFFAALFQQLAAAGLAGGARQLSSRNNQILRIQSKGGVRFKEALAFTKDQCFRMELYLEPAQRGLDVKWAFDRLQAEAAAIEAELGTALTWERCDDADACRIALYHPTFITASAPALAALREWIVQWLPRFREVLWGHALEATEEAA